ncbi:MAG: Rieske 2Fe-2S domain-containing protein [Aquirufa sp.]|jgi:nitrite reductase/ring-hydroxylating ferredoxin subunit
MEERIKRNEFLKSLGLKGAALLAVYCGASACQADAGVTPASNVDFTLDVSALAVGKYLINSKVVVARVSSSSYVAVSQVCPHENLLALTFNGTNFYCGQHGASFSTSGTALSVTSRSLTVYKTALTGTSLRVYS